MTASKGETRDPLQARPSGGAEYTRVCPSWPQRRDVQLCNTNEGLPVYANNCLPLGGGLPLLWLFRVSARRLAKGGRTRLAALPLLPECACRTRPSSETERQPPLCSSNTQASQYSYLLIHPSLHHLRPSNNMVSTKHVVNEPRQLVNDGLAGLARLNPNVKVDANYRVTTLAEVPQDRVALVRGCCHLRVSRRQRPLLSHLCSRARQKMLIPCLLVSTYARCVPLESLCLPCCTDLRRRFWA